MTRTLQGIVYDVDERTYHAHPALSSTQVKHFIDSPALYRWHLKHPREDTAAFDLGSAVHAKVLGVGWGIEGLDYPNWLTKAAQAARKEAREAGLIPMLTHELEVVHAMTEAVLANRDAARLLTGGRPEVSVFSTDPHTGIDMRCRFDYLHDDHRLAVDLKTTAGKASIAGFSDAVAKYGYDVSRAHYLDTIEFATGERPEMVFVVVEKEPPFLTGVFRLSDDEIHMGTVEARAARAKLRACLDTDIWPGRPSGIQITKAPMWRIYQHQDRYGGD